MDDVPVINSEHIIIKNKSDLDYLLNRIQNGPLFAESFSFRRVDLFIKLLKALNISYDRFIKKYYYYDRSRNLHISESENKFVWISTYGLVAREVKTENNYLNACNNQYCVVSLLFEKAEKILKSKDIYDVDKYTFDYLSKFTPAFFQNVVFYIEVFGKAYLSLNCVDFKRTHSLKELYSLIKKEMFQKGHNDTVFHAEILTEFLKVSDYISSIPGGFKEQYIKYDDNSEDHTIIIFDPVYIEHLHSVVDMSNDLINNFYYDKSNVIFLRPGLYQRILNKAKNETDKTNIALLYGYLLEN